MHYFPINLDINDRLCIVIGGGRVAERKVKGLLECGGIVKVISLELTPELSKLADQQKITVIRKEYEPGDLGSAFLVIAATDDPEAQSLIYHEAEERQLLVNVADVPKRCNFILPATVRRGDLTVSVSTSGSSPAFAKQLRKKLENWLQSEYGALLEILRHLRPQVLNLNLPHSENKLVFEKLVEYSGRVI